MALEMESAAQQGETVGFDPDSQPGQASMRRTMVHCNHKIGETEAHLWGSNMPAKQQEREH
jgi:hypothetical protein